jgi:Mn2+/Fe2+ NRAMP family transporter
MIATMLFLLRLIVAAWAAYSIAAYSFFAPHPTRRGPIPSWASRHSTAMAYFLTVVIGSVIFLGLIGLLNFR